MSAVALAKAELPDTLARDARSLLCSLRLQPVQTYRDSPLNNGWSLDTLHCTAIIAPVLDFSTNHWPVDGR